MMDTCMECVHHNICVKWRKPALYGVEKKIGCGDFKARSHIVEVVYCGECRLADTKECPMSGTKGRVSASDFCSYGERKDIEE